MLHELSLLLLPLAAGVGWWSASKKYSDDAVLDKKEKGAQLPKDYLLGLNFLLNEENDKALDVFIKMLNVDSETIETHLALGNLFRRRGEVDRAIRIHQNLIARPNLNRECRTQALLALAKDYFSAGVLDRAEKLFLELIELDAHAEIALKNLLDIYQQEHEWQRAIDVVKKMPKMYCGQYNILISHYYCELAEIALNAFQDDQASKYLKQALSVDKNCVRGNLLSATLLMNQGKYQAAIRLLKKIKMQDSDFFSEAIIPLVKAYRALSQETELIQYLKSVLDEYPKMPIVIMLSEQISQWRGDKVAANFVANYVRKYPSIAGVHRLITLYLPTVEGKAKQDLLMLHALMQKLMDENQPYQCQSCGFAVNTLHWLCPSCKKWNLIKPTHALEAM